MFTLNCNGKLLTVTTPLVMGIINTTPDSFYEGSRFQGNDGILSQAEKMLKQGATILDIGGQSTRPGSELINPEEEMKRVIPAVESLHYNFPEAILSIDTFYATVAHEAVKAGAGIINDVSGGTLDKQMLITAGKLQVPYVCMHIKGTPANMQQHAIYKNVTLEVADYFIQKLEVCRLAGINDVIIDPGFGFAKTIEHNFQLLKELAVFKMFEKPILSGISRKGTIYKTLGISPAEALNGTTALNMTALMNGASILRVHDVKEAMEVIKLYQQIA